MSELLNQDIAEVKTTNHEHEANALLEKGWKLLETCKEISDAGPSLNVQFVLGRPKTLEEQSQQIDRNKLIEDYCNMTS